MRINLATPFAEKDAAKALGARWDSAQKTWYITDVADLGPFLRWLPDAAQPAPKASRATSAAPPRARAAASPAAGNTVTSSVTVIVFCGCAVLPWEPCRHS